MKGLAALLFHRSAAPEKSENARAPKPAESFAHVLQTSLGDPRRDSRPGSSSASSAEVLPKSESTRAPKSEAAKHDQGEDGLLTQQRSAGRRGKPEVQIDLSATTGKSFRREYSANANPKASDRGSAASSSPRTTEAHPVTTHRSEPGRVRPLPSQPEAAPESRRSVAAPPSHVSATAGQTKALAKPETLDGEPTNRQVTATTPAPSAEKAEAEPSGEKKMPPHTSALLNTHANPVAPGPRSGERVQPQAWKIAGADIAPGAPVASNQGAQALADGQPVRVSQDAPLTLSRPEGALPGRPELPIQQDFIPSATPAEPEIQPPTSQPALPEVKAPALEHPPVGRMHRHTGEQVDHCVSSAPTPATPASPERPIPSSQPSIPNAEPTVTMPSESAASPETSPITQAYGDSASVPADTSADQPEALTRPSPDPIGLPQAPEPGVRPSLSQPHAETPRARDLRHGDTTSPITAEPKADRARPMPMDARPSLPHTSFRANAEVKSSSLVAPSPVLGPDLPHPTEDHSGTTTQAKASPLADSAIPQGEPVLDVPADREPMLVLPRPSSPSLPEQKPAAVLAQRTPKSSNPSPVAQDFVPRPQAKPIAHHAASVSETASPQTVPTSPTRTARAEAQTVVPRPSSPEAKRVDRPAHPLTSRQPVEAQGIPVVRRSERAGEGHQLSFTRPSTEGAHLSTQSTPKIPGKEETISDGHALSATDTMIDGLELPVAALPLTVSTEVGQEASAPPVNLEPLQDEPMASPLGQPDIQPQASESTVLAPKIAELVVPVPFEHASLHHAEPSTTLGTDALPAPLPQATSASNDSTDTLPAPLPQATTPSATTDFTDALPAPLPQTAIPSAPTDFGDALPAPLPQATIPSAPTGFTGTQPASPKHDSPASGKVSLTHTPPVQTRSEQAQPNLASPAVVPTRIEAHPSDQGISARPVSPKSNHGEHVPAAHQPAAEAVMPSAHPLPNPPVASPDLMAAPPLPEPAPSAEVASNPPVIKVGAPTVEATAPTASAQPKVDHGSPRIGHQGPRAPHPGSHHTHSENLARPVAASLPSPAPQVESQPEPVAAKSEDDPSPVVPASTTVSASGNDAALPVPATPIQTPAPPVATAVPMQPDKPAPRADGLAPSIAPVVPASPALSAPNLPATITPSALPQAQDAQPHRRVRSADDDPRFTDLPALPTPAQQPQHPRHHAAPAPSSGANLENQNSFANPNPSSPPSAQAAPAIPSTSDRPADRPAPPVPATPNVNAVASAPASPAPVAVPAPPVEVRHPRLPNHVSSAAQAGPDAGLSMTVMPHAAHMSIESNDGDLALHLRVRHGSADVSVSGTMAPLFETRAPEARAALASEGLNLGRFDLGQQGGGGQQGQPAPERPERAPEPATPYRHQSSHHEPPTPGDGRIHVTA